MTYFKAVKWATSSVPALDTLQLLFPLPVVLFSRLFMNSLLFILQMKLATSPSPHVPNLKALSLLPRSLMVMSLWQYALYLFLSEIILLISLFHLPNLAELHRQAFHLIHCYYYLGVDGNNSITWESKRCKIFCPLSIFFCFLPQ